jgi:hypothetical protein
MATSRSTHIWLTFAAIACLFPGESIHLGRLPMSAQAARDLIIRMKESYDPPPHLVMNARARAGVLADYENALAGFDAHTLDQAWRRVVAQHTRWTWPTCGELVKAAEFFSPRRQGPSEEEKRRMHAKALADTYTHRFLETFHLAKLADREGWLPPLRKYVEAAAWVQAQLIAGVIHTDWNLRLLVPDQIGQGSSQELFDAYRATFAVANAVHRGHIRVEVPKARIQQWQAEGHAGLYHQEEQQATAFREQLEMRRRQNAAEAGKQGLSQLTKKDADDAPAPSAHRNGRS